ncbi:MAG: HAD family hydrolase [Nitrososphaerales archaeon]
MIKVISFDLDGTLVRKEFTDDFWLYAIPKKYAELKNLSFEEAKALILKMYEEVGQEDLRWYIPNYWIKYLGLKDNIESLAELVKGESIYYDDVKETLKVLSKSFRLVIVTSNPRDFLEFKIKAIKSYITESFSCIDDLKSPRKNRDFYLLVCSKLDLKPEELAHVGDDPLYDYILPRSLGINSFLIDRNLNRSNNDRINSLLELIKLL